MSLVTLSSTFGDAGTGLSDGTLKAALQELQSLKDVVVSGAAANTDIAIANIKTTDTIKSVIEFTAGVPSDITSTVSITSAGHIQSTSATTGNKLVVSYYTKP
jgi:hypothetical protein